MIRAVKVAIRPVEDAVESAARSIQRYGILAESISIKVKGYKTAVAGIVGPKSKYKKRKGVVTRGKNKGQPVWHSPAKYAALVEKGTKHSRPRPFLKPALDKSKEQYLEQVQTEIGKEIETALAKRG